MKSHGSSLGLGLLVLTLGVGVSCKKEEAPKPDPAAAQPASASPPSPPMRHPGRGPGPRLDPQANKEHRLDYCYYGTFSLRQARDAYLASLGKDEPSAKKIPNLGAPPLPPAPGAPSATPATTPAAKPPATPPAKPGASSAAPTVPPADRRLDPSVRLPHERNARSCTASLALKDPPMADVDAAVAIFAPFAVELSKDISAAQTYYQQQDYTKDSFARGKELDKKLREEFAKLDDLSDKLGAALAAWHKEHPADASKMEEGEKDARGAIDAAHDVFMLVVTKKVDGDAWKTAVEKLDKSTEALKTFADGHPADVWGRMIVASLEPFIKTVKAAKITPDKSLDGDSYLILINNFTNLLDARLRAGSRAALAHPVAPMLPNAPAPGAQPPAPGAQPPPP